jgi:hypothetical protein
MAKSMNPLEKSVRDMVIEEIDIIKQQLEGSLMAAEDTLNEEEKTIFENAEKFEKQAEKNIQERAWSRAMSDLFNARESILKLRKMIWRSGIKPELLEKELFHIKNILSEPELAQGTHGQEVSFLLDIAKKITADCEVNLRKGEVELAFLKLRMIFPVLERARFIKEGRRPLDLEIRDGMEELERLLNRCEENMKQGNIHGRHPVMVEKAHGHLIKAKEFIDRKMWLRAKNEIFLGTKLAIRALEENEPQIMETNFERELKKFEILIESARKELKDCPNIKAQELIEKANDLRDRAFESVKNKHWEKAKFEMDRATDCAIEAIEIIREKRDLGKGMQFEPGFFGLHAGIF